MRSLTFAAAGWPFDWHDDWASYEAKVRDWVQKAVERDADVLLFPEYGALELASLGGHEVASDLERAFEEVMAHRPAMDALFEMLAMETGRHILAPSGPVAEGRARMNRAYFYGPDGVVGHCDKVMMTRFEREISHFTAGECVSLFDTPLGLIGVLIGYDAEFPLLARSLCEAGAEVLLIPSCSDTTFGMWRARGAAMARAQENQCVCAHAVTVGNAPWCPVISENHGMTGVYGPSDKGWPETGILSEGIADTSGWLGAQADLDKVLESRGNGTAMPFVHWLEQLPASADVRILAAKRRFC